MDLLSDPKRESVTSLSLSFNLCGAEGNKKGIALFGRRVDNKQFTMSLLKSETLPKGEQQQQPRSYNSDYRNRICLLPICLPLFPPDTRGVESIHSPGGKSIVSDSKHLSDELHTQSPSTSCSTSMCRGSRWTNSLHSDDGVWRVGEKKGQMSSIPKLIWRAVCRCCCRRPRSAPAVPHCSTVCLAYSLSPLDSFHPPRCNSGYVAI